MREKGENLSHLGRREKKGKAVPPFEGSVTECGRKKKRTKKERGNFSSIGKNDIKNESVLHAKEGGTLISIEGKRREGMPLRGRQIGGKNPPDVSEGKGKRDLASSMSEKICSETDRGSGATHQSHIVEEGERGGKFLLFLDGGKRKGVHERVPNIELMAGISRKGKRRKKTIVAGGRKKRKGLSPGPESSSGREFSLKERKGGDEDFLEQSLQKASWKKSREKGKSTIVPSGVGCKGRKGRKSP